MEKTSYLDLLAQYGVNGAHPGGMALTKALMRREKITSDTVLLDVGCGTGETSAFIARNYPCQIAAVDISPHMLERARQMFVKAQLNIPLYRANAMDLPFHRNTFDIVLSESVLTFTHIRRTLREFYRVLKPGGVLLTVEATAAQPLTEDDLNDIKSVIGVSYVPTMDEWQQAFEDAGFSKIQVVYRKKYNWFVTTPNTNHVFDEYFNMMSRQRKNVGFGVYRCQI